MADYTTVFETLKGFLPMNILEKAINETGTEHGTKKFTVLRQLNTMMYAHLTGKTSLRDIEAGIVADKKLQEHTGTISFSQISRVNSDRDTDVFKMIFEATLAKLKKHHGIRIVPGSWDILKALDSTIVRLCIVLFPWADYRDKTAAVKVHTLYDVLLGCPENIVVTEGIIHDKEKMKTFVTEPGVTYLYDRAYIDYKEYDRYCKEGIFFISRLKKNAIIQVLNENAVVKGSTVLSDREVILGCISTKMQHPVRIIQVIDSSNGELFHIVTNRFDLTAEEIAEIYRLRWTIEIFFKWIKQHLTIKKFFGTSFNAVLNQIYSALILFCLLKLMHILVGTKHDFLKMVRLITNGLWNTVPQLKEDLVPKKPPPVQRQKRFNWKQEYETVLR
ncbi:MAG: IS4 family transposase [Bacillota bacterium]|nr:IS4 family transposase [Bacillota bacterium]